MTIFGLSRRVHSFCLEPMSRKDTTPVFYCFQKVQPKYKNSIPLHPGEAYSSKGLIFVRYVVKPTSSGKKYFLHSLRKNSRLFAFFVISSTCVFHFGGGGMAPLAPSWIRLWHRARRVGASSGRTFRLLYSLAMT